MWSTLKSTSSLHIEALGFCIWTRFPAAVPSLFSLLSSLFYELGQAVTRRTKLQAAVPAIFYFLFWQQCLLFSLVAVSPFQRLSCLQLAVLF